MNITAAPTIDRMSNIYNNSVVRYWQFLFHDLSGKFTLHDITLWLLNYQNNSDLILYTSFYFINIVIMISLNLSSFNLRNFWR